MPRQECEIYPSGYYDAVLLDFDRGFKAIGSVPIAFIAFLVL